MDALDFRYAKSVILKLLEKDTFMKSELFKIVSSNQTLDKLLDALEKDGYVTKISSKYGRRTYSISLTDKGRTAAEQLKRMDAVAARTETYELPPDFDKEFEGLSAMTHLNVLDDHIAITEHNYDGTGKDRIVMVYVKLNGRGIMRLFCEVDDAYECKHTRYAWTLPSVQEMVQIQRDKGNMKEQ
jgi:DNA-binding MarR family transcriptional regulator